MGVAPSPALAGYTAIPPLAPRNSSGTQRALPWLPLAAGRQRCPYSTGRLGVALGVGLGVKVGVPVSSGRSWQPAPLVGLAVGVLVAVPVGVLVRVGVPV